MAAPSKDDAHNARIRHSLTLPFKRRIGGLTIRTEILQDELDGKSAAQDETRSGALDAIAEIDDQVRLLADLKLPEGKYARESDAEMKGLVEAFAGLRLTLVGIAGSPTAA